MRRGQFAPFFQEPCFRVQNPIADNKTRRPKISITASFEDSLVFMLAKSGYFNSNPETIYSTRVDYVMKCYHYEIFTREYENTMIELNKETK